MNCSTLLAKKERTGKADNYLYLFGEEMELFTSVSRSKTCDQSEALS